MKVYGHRGSNQHQLENSWSAFYQSLTEGADGVELDVQMSADGHPVVIHDRNLLRTTGIDALVSDLTKKELKDIRLLNGEPIPMLKDVTKKLLPFAEINVELKSEDKQDARIVGELIAASSHWMKVTISSSHLKPMRTIAKDFSFLRRAMVVDTAFKNDPDTAFRAMERSRSSAIHAIHSIINRKFVAEANLRGWNVCAWFTMKGEGANKMAAWQRLSNAQVSCVITNDPAAFLDWRQASRANIRAI